MGRIKVTKFAEVFLTMLFPPSLSTEVLDRSFRAQNGEVGVLLGDAEAFLAACDRDEIELLGWELWLVDHICDPDSGEPQRQDGVVWGTVPTGAMLEPSPPMFVGGSGNSQQTRRDIAALSLHDEIKARWLGHIRFNFTLVSGSS